MDSASENYKRNKNKKRTLESLDPQQIRKLVELLARDASAGEIEIKLSISSMDLDTYKNRMGIATIEDAKNKLVELEQADTLLEKVAVQEREQARKDRLEAQARFDKMNALADAKSKEKLLLASDKARLLEQEMKTADAERQKNFNEKRQKTGDLLAQYRVPSKRYVGTSVEVSRGRQDPKFDDVGTSEFREMLLHKGLSFIRDKYNVGDSDIRGEIENRGITLDFDLLPR